MPKHPALALVAMLAATSSVYAQSQGGRLTPPMLDNSQASGSATNIITGAAPAQAEASSGPAPAAAQATPAPAAAKVSTATPDSTVPGSSLQPFGDWALECFEAPIEGIKCQLLQKVVSAQGQAVLAVALAADPRSNSTNLQIAVPLGVSVSAGTQIVVGSDYQGAVHIGSCTQRGCLIQGTASEALLDAMKREKAATVVVFNEAKKQIPIQFSLMGFTQAYEAMLKANGTT